MNDIEFKRTDDGRYYSVLDTRYYYSKQDGQWICESLWGGYRDVVPEGKFTQALESFIRKQKLEKLLGKRL